MKKDNRSHNSTSNLSIITQDFLLPSWPKILLYLLVGALALVLWDSKLIWQQFNHSILAQDSFGLTTSSINHANGVEQAFDNLWDGRLAQILFWALAGCIVYVCIWFVVNVFTNIRNDIVADEYIHPTDYNRAGYWQSVLARKVFLVATLLTFLGVLGTNLRILPVLASFFYSDLQNFHPSPSIMQITGSVVSAALLIYLLVLLAHITVNSWRTVYTDL